MGMPPIYEYADVIVKKLTDEILAFTPQSPEEIIAGIPLSASFEKMMEMMAKAMKKRYENPDGFDKTIIMGEQEFKSVDGTYKIKKAEIEFSLVVVDAMPNEHYASTGGIRTSGAEREGDYMNLFLTFNLYIDKPTLEQFKIDEKVRDIVTKNLRSTISHELTHGHEEYNRISHDSISISGSIEKMYDAAASALMHGISNGKSPLKQFLYNIYTSSSHEINARVAQVETHIKGKTGQARIDAIKASDEWNIANNLTTFDADKCHKMLILDIKRAFYNDKTKSVEDVLKIIAEGFSKVLSQQIELQQSHKSDVQHSDRREKIERNIAKHETELVGKPYESLQALMKRFEPKFHEAGERMKRRLLKAASV